MRRAAMFALSLFGFGCSPTHWQIAPGNGNDGSILLNTQTGETWVESHQLIENPKGVFSTGEPYWKKMGTEPPATMP